MLYDVIIPLSKESHSNDDELRILLRSIERNISDVGRIIIVGPRKPEWVQEVDFIQFEDGLEHNKDGNIINKVLYVCQNVQDLSDDFIFCSDDEVFLMPFSFQFLCPVYNPRDREAFASSNHIWPRRVARTFDYLKSKGLQLSFNFESHCPFKYPKKELLEVMKGVDYTSDIGYSINTLFCGLLGYKSGYEQRVLKATFEDAQSVKTQNIEKMFAGYNDEAFYNGLRDRLFGLFPYASKYEKHLKA